MNALASLNKNWDAEVDQAIARGLAKDFHGVLQALRKNDGSGSLFLRALANIHLGEKDRALALLKILSERPDAHFLTPAFCDWITGTSQEADKMYQSSEFPKYFETASQSKYFEAGYRIIENIIVNSRPIGTDLILVDLGIGTGHHIERLERTLRREWSHLNRLYVFGVDSSPEMLAQTEERLSDIKRSTFLKFEFHLTKARFQDLGPDFFNTLMPGRRPHFVNACASIHHMRKEEKISLLKAIHGWRTEKLIITDADSNHESTLGDLSFELVANVTSFYENVLHYMKNEGPSPEQLEHYRRFCFFDARNVLFETGEKRIEFHARAQQWIDYLDETDFCWIKAEQAWLTGLDPQTSNLNLKYVTSAKTSRPLSFTVVARPW